MFHTLIAAFRNRYIAVQLWMLVIYLILDAFGLGLGILKHIFNRPLTYSGKFLIGDLVFGAPPIGPNRLSNTERTGTAERISAAFGGTPPAYKLLADMTGHFHLSNSALCHFRGPNIARGAHDCNALGNATSYYLALLGAMHPKNEVLLTANVTGYKGDPIDVAFFPDRHGKPRILIDLSRVRSSQWYTALGFKLKAYNGDGVAEISLKGAERSRGIYLIDDPGVLSRRDARCDRPACFARLLLYAYDHEGFRNAATGVLSTRNLADIVMDADIEKRFELYAAALGRPVPAPSMKLDTSYKPEKIAVSDWTTTHIKNDLDAVMGIGATTRSIFSPVGYNVAFGSVYAFLLDGKRHLIWHGGTPYPSLGTDKFVFHWKSGTRLEPVAPLGHSRGLWVLPLPPASLRAATLVVHKAIQPSGKPWSWFSDFSAVMGPLAKM